MTTARTPRSILASALAGAALFTGAPARAAGGRVAVLAPDASPVGARLERNVASMKREVARGTVSICTRDVVTRMLGDLEADSALCADADQIGVWSREDGRLVLKDAVLLGDDARAQELAAARAVMALEAPSAKGAPPPSASPTFTFVATGAGQALERPALESPALESLAPSTDAPSPVAPRHEPERKAPPLVLALGPGVAVGRDGGSFAVTAAAEIGVTRHVAIVPWLQFVPANRTVERPLGSAEYRPTIFGFGFDVPLLPHSSVVVPRIGSGYGILWMHVAPVSASAPATARAPEDLVAPMMYVTTALSVRVAENLRVAGEGMVGASSHDMIVRIANEKVAHWGVPVASLTLRGEWVMR